MPGALSPLVGRVLLSNPIPSPDDEDDPNMTPTCTASTKVLNRLFKVLCLGLALTPTLLKIPLTQTLSPGFARSTSSSYTHTSTLCGVWPAGTSSGVSWIFQIWWSAKWERLWISVRDC